ncbi:MAG: universal stress protein [Rhodococcus sp. (in: high G+C Gram-positive bacteria)]|uniref:universal stress protein n=1 Tax=Rhodococcus sp. TaxID=1831 RepID=UPI003BB13C2C
MIVAGVDSSAESRNATRWAATVAARRGIPLHIVHVVPPDITFYGEPGDNAITDEYRAAGEALAADVLSVVQSDEPTLAVQCSVRTGSTAADVLLDAARDASMVVIGSKFSGPIEGYLNATALRLAHHAPSALTVWRGPDRDARPDRRPVVVGVDGSPCSTAAVAQAFDLASLFDAPLVAVHSWTEGFPHQTGPPPAIAHRYPVAEAEQALLAENLAGWPQQYPDVAVTQVTESGTPADVLLHACRDAQLLVVGTHGRTSLGRALLGSTSQDMLHRAPCPTMVCREHSAPTTTR